MANTASSSEKHNIPFVLYILSISIGRKKHRWKVMNFLAVRSLSVSSWLFSMELAMGNPPSISNHPV